MLAILSLGLAFPATGAAGPVDCGSRPIRLAFYEYGYLYDQDRGIDRDVVDELVRRTGCAFEFQVMPRARIWADLAAGTLDMSVSGIQTAERDRFAWFAPYLSMKNYALVHASLAAQVRHAEDFLAQPELTFGVVRAFRHGAEQDRWLDRLRRAGRVQESPDVETLFRKLAQGRVDALFSQPPVYRKYLLDQNLRDTVAILDWTPGEQGVPHGLILARSRFSEAEAGRWRSVLKQMRDDGSLKRIFSRYLPPADVERLLDY